MDVQIKAKMGRFITLLKDGKEYTGILTGKSKRVPVNQGNRVKQRDHGWIIRNGQLEQWEVIATVEIDDRRYVYGQYIEGTTMANLVEHEKGFDLSYLQRYIKALQLLQGKIEYTAHLHTESILFCHDGSLFFIPESVFNNINQVSNEEERIRYMESFNHPDLRGEANQSFIIGTLAYKLMTGSFPYTGKDEEDIHEKMRNMSLVPPRYINPNLKEDISEVIHKAIRKGDKKSYSLKEWEGFVSQWIREGTEENVTSLEEQRLKEEGQKLQEKAQKRYNTLMFFQKQWKTIAVAMVLVVVVGSVLGTVLQNKFAPRATIGMPPDEVVRTFYMSINDFDHETIEDCFIEDAGKAEINMATHLFVISRMRMGYEGTNPYVDAQKWIDAGKPDIGKNQIVYGVGDLKIELESGKDGEVIFKTTYKRWMPNEQEVAAEIAKSDQQQVEIPASIGFEMEDRVYLRDQEKFWGIYKIENLKKEAMKVSILFFT